MARVPKSLAHQGACLNFSSEAKARKFLILQGKFYSSKSRGFYFNGTTHN
jgi:hypothetical protein